MGNIFQKLWQFFKNIFRAHDAKLHRLFPVLILVIYSFIGGGIFYPLLKQKRTPEKQINITFWTSLYYSSTAYTTIGYGRVTCHPDAALCRAITIIYSLFGIPLTLVTLNRLGKFLAAIACHFWHECCLCKLCKKKTKKAKVDDNEKGGRNSAKKKKLVKRTLPLWVTFLILVTWLLLMALVFFLTQNWSYGTSLYFVMESIMTIGFGDVTEQPETALCLLYQALIIIGLSLFSMLINVAEDHVDQLAVALSARITEKYKEKLANEDSEQDQSKPSSINSALRKTTTIAFLPDKGQAGKMGVLGGGGSKKEEEEGGFLKTVKGGWYKFLLNETTRERLEDEYEKKIKMKCRKTQTAANTKTVFTQTSEKNWEKIRVKRHSHKHHHHKETENNDDPAGKDKDPDADADADAETGLGFIFNKIMNKLGSTNKDDTDEKDKEL